MNIPKLKSRYIPVHNYAFIKLMDCQWWKENAKINYPNVLINLDTFTPEQSKKDIPDDVFLLTDSGGFQVIRGQCNFGWEESLQRQINLNATKIFSFDIPPVKRKAGDQNVWFSMEEHEVKKIIDINIDTAIKQSNWLKEKYPDKLNRFCYVMQSTSINTMKYNLESLENKIGMSHFDEYFPGGIVASCKSQDILLYAIIARYLYDNFIVKGRYVHYLGIGSFYKMLITIRNELTTFDSSNVLRGASHWEVYNPLKPQKILKINKDNFFLLKQFCLCPNCSEIDFLPLLKQEKYTEIGGHFILHNLYHHLAMNIFLDSIDKRHYSKLLIERFQLSKQVIHALHFCDACDRVGFDIALSKYKFYLKKDDSKQKRLF